MGIELLNFDNAVVSRFYYQKVPVEFLRDISLREAVDYCRQEPLLNPYILMSNVFAVLRDRRWILAGSYGLMDHCRYTVLYELLELRERRRSMRTFMVPTDRARIVTRIGDRRWKAPTNRPVVSSAEEALSSFHTPENDKIYGNVTNCILVDSFVGE